MEHQRPMWAKVVCVAAALLSFALAILGAVSGRWDSFLILTALGFSAFLGGAVLYAISGESHDI